VRPYSPARLLTFQLPAADSLVSFAPCPAFPGSDYYETSAPPDDHQPATGLPSPHLARREEGGHRWFPRSPRTDRRGRRPAVIPAASPQLRRRPSPWPPRPALSAGHRASSPHSRPPCTAPRPRSARFRAGSSLTGRRHWFLSVHLLVSLAGPAPSGSTGTSRRCQGCFPPSPASPGSGCPQLHPAAATARRCRSPTSTRIHSASWRTMASIKRTA
jgi:hypothetical protein